MTQYVVILGTFGFHLRTEKRGFWQRREVVIRKFGAYTTRLVSANDASGAILLAIESARNELLAHTVETNLDHLQFEVESIREAGPDHVGPTRGFTFYADDAE